MDLVELYAEARRDEGRARLRRALALRAMAATGQSQRAIAGALGVSQPAISQQLAAGSLAAVDAQTLLDAAAPILRGLAAHRGFEELAVFGSVARHEATDDSDIDLLVRQPPGTTIGSLLALRDLFAAVLDRSVDLVTYGSLRRGIDDDIKREAVLV